MMISKGLARGGRYWCNYRGGSQTNIMRVFYETRLHRAGTVHSNRTFQNMIPVQVPRIKTRLHVVRFYRRTKS
jgi:hypothetical protein